MLAEIALGIILAFSIGTYAGMEEGKKTKKPMPPREPSIWPPISHERLMKTCSVACGENNFKEYSVMYGKCVCRK